MADVASYYTGWSSLALDEGGYPHISYYTCFGDDLKYAYQDASGWNIETVDRQGDVGDCSSLALDGDGYPHISYYRYTTINVEHAYRDASGWHIQTVGRRGEYTSLAVNGNDYSHIIYFDYTNDDHKYAYEEAAGWHTQTVGYAECVVGDTCLALSDAGYPRISYYSVRGGGNLKYAHQDTAGWHIEIVDNAGTGQYRSLALDGGGYGRISYYDYVRDDLKYAHQDCAGYLSHPPNLECKIRVCGWGLDFVSDNTAGWQVTQT